jgi:hypothetical protein
MNTRAHPHGAWRMTDLPSSRQPVWSDTLTVPLAAVIPAARRTLALRAIKAFHTAAFVAISAAILLFTCEGMRGRRGRAARAAASIAIAETIVYASNNQVCPLTPLAEQLGATSGSVTDIYLPAWISERIPVFGGSLLVIGSVAQIVAWRRRPSGATSARDHDDVTRRSLGNF